MKRNYKIVLGLVFLVVVLLVVWLLLRRIGIRLMPPDIDAPTAPTSIPIATATSAVTETLPGETSTPALGDNSDKEATATATLTPVPEVKATRVVPPPEPIMLPTGFEISVYADQLAGPRMMTLSPEGDLVVAERSANRIVRLPDRDGDGVTDGVEVLADQLSSPSSMVYFEDGSLYVGETERILRLSAPDAQGMFQQRETIIDGLPAGGHETRTVLFSADWQYLYVSIGSSCNVCNEADYRRATVMRYRPDGSDETVFTSGLRNAVGLILDPSTGNIWVSNNGRDWLGDDQPPETVYRISQGDDAGWPRCHSGRIVDPEFGSGSACDGVLAPEVEMQAHSAPLGLTFYSGMQFPEAYTSGLFVAFHGSWNRDEATGYKIVYISLDGESAGTVQDFATGWLREDGSRWGRPVDVLTATDGSLFISDDYGGRIFRVFYRTP